MHTPQSLEATESAPSMPDISSSSPQSPDPDPTLVSLDPGHDSVPRTESSLDTVASLDPELESDQSRHSGPAAQPNSVIENDSATQPDSVIENDSADPDPDPVPQRKSTRQKK